MNIEQNVIEYLRKLPPEKQQEVLDFTQFLSQKISLPKPDPNLTPEQRAANWLAWVDSHKSYNLPLPDEALHRDTILTSSSEEQLTPKEKVEKWNKVIAKLPQTSANLPDEALHRDTMYEDEYE